MLYIILKKLDIFLQNSNFLFYDIYYEPLNCLQCAQAIKNSEKYQNLYLLKGNKHNNIDDVRVWLIHYKQYYYLFAVVNIHPNAEDEHLPQPRNILFKKLTLQELMAYDNGSYWKLIKDYNIKID